MATKSQAKPQVKAQAKAQKGLEFDSMSLEELKDIRKRVDKAIEGFEARKKAAAFAEMEEAAKKYGFTLAQLTGGKVGRKQAVSTPKYANPSDPSQTWTGRGRKPKWMEEALKAGKALQDMLIA